MSSQFTKILIFGLVAFIFIGLLSGKGKLHRKLQSVSLTTTYSATLTVDITFGHLITLPDARTMIFAHADSLKHFYLQASDTQTTNFAQLASYTGTTLSPHENFISLGVLANSSGDQIISFQQVSASHDQNNLVTYSYSSGNFQIGLTKTAFFTGNQDILNSCVVADSVNLNDTYFLAFVWLINIASVKAFQIYKIQWTDYSIKTYWEYSDSFFYPVTRSTTKIFMITPENYVVFITMANSMTFCFWFIDPINEHAYGASSPATEYSNSNMVLNENYAYTYDSTHNLIIIGLIESNLLTVVVKTLFFKFSLPGTASLSFSLSLESSLLSQGAIKYITTVNNFVIIATDTWIRSYQVDFTAKTFQSWRNIPISIQSLAYFLPIQPFNDSRYDIYLNFNDGVKSKVSRLESDTSCLFYTSIEDGTTYCRTQCTASQFEYNKTCVTCKDPTPYFNGDGQCISSCINPAPLIGPNNLCLSVCPEGYIFKIDYKQCSLTCPYLLDNTGECVTACPQEYSYVQEGHCVDGCSYPSPYIDSNKNCLSSCTAKLYNSIYCVNECPSDYPYLSPTNTCTNSCPINAPLISIDKKCTVSCNINEFVYISGSYKFCVNLCPSDAPYTNLDIGQCVASCPAYIYNNTCYSSCPGGLLAYIGTCFATCPSNTVAETGKCSNCADNGRYYYQGQCIFIQSYGTKIVNLTFNVLVDCQSLTPPEYIYNNSCVTTCPDGFKVDSNNVCQSPSVPNINTGSNTTSNTGSNTTSNTGSNTTSNTGSSNSTSSNSGNYGSADPDNSSLPFNLEDEIDNVILNYEASQKNSDIQSNIITLLDSIVSKENSKSSSGLFYSNQTLSFGIVNTSQSGLDELNSFANEHNLSTIDISFCEKKLREYYNISPSDHLIIGKVDFNKSSLQDSPPYLSAVNMSDLVYYQIYDKSGNKLNLSVCTNSSISVSLSLSESAKENILSSYTEFQSQGVNIFNETDPFFNDKCYSYSQNNTDMTLSDRRKDIYVNSTMLCTSSCKMTDLNSTSGRVTCECSSDLKSRDDYFLSKAIFSVIIDSNFFVILCIKNLSKKNILTNLGLFVFIGLQFLHLLTFIVLIVIRKIDKYIVAHLFQIFSSDCLTAELTYTIPKMGSEFLKTGEPGANPPRSKMSNDIPEIPALSSENSISLRPTTVIIQPKLNQQQENTPVSFSSSSDNSLAFIGVTPPKISIHLAQLKSSSKSTEKSSNQEIFHVQSNEDNAITKKGKFPRFKPKSEKKIRNKLVIFDNYIDESKENPCKADQSSKDPFPHDNSFRKQLTGVAMKRKKSSVKNIAFTHISQAEDFTNKDYEDMPFDQILKYEKRSLCTYYLRMLQDDHLILSLFFCHSLIIPRFIRILTLFTNISLDIALNAAFYSDGYIANRYSYSTVVANAYSFLLLDELPKSLWSLLLSSFITMLLRNIRTPSAQVEDQFNSFLKTKDPSQISIAYKIYLREMRIRYTLFIVIVILLQCFSAYICICFCTVFVNCQISWILGSLVSISIGLLGFEVIIPFLDSGFRYLAISCKSRCLYEFKLISDVLNLLKG